MSVRIRLKRFGTQKRPYYRIVVMDSRTPRDGRPIEEIGFYHPLEMEERQVNVRVDRIKEWISKGAQPSSTVRMLLKRKSISSKEEQA
ncbi:MAG: 30S ribosomal protein S16 [Spirochaetales bacterium]|nr:30S ribosomal protein S16 [Spirochaetales bacterium]